MLGEMRPSELGRWFEFYNTNPWGDQRADARAGLICATVANVNRDPKQRQEPFVPGDFMMFIETVELDDDDIENRITAVFDARIKAQEKQ